MVFDFVAASGASITLIALMGLAAYYDRRCGWVRQRTDFVQDLMNDWASTRSVNLPDVETVESVQPRPAFAFTSDLMALNKGLGAVTVHVAPKGRGATVKSTMETSGQVVRS